VKFVQGMCVDAMSSEVRPLDVGLAGSGHLQTLFKCTPARVSGFGLRSLAAVAVPAT
jgi:hypothetical protein